MKFPTIRQQINSMTAAQRTTFENSIPLEYVVNGLTVTYASGSEQTELLETVYGDWHIPNFAITYPRYVWRNKDNLAKLLTAMSKELTEQFAEHSETVTDIAPATIKNYITEPLRSEKIKRAPFDSSTTKIDTETETITNNGTEYQSNKAVTEYDTTLTDGHTSKVVNDKDGNNYPLTKIITEEIKNRFSDYLSDFIETYLKTYGYRAEAIM